METRRPMDRLVVGDVGYGKTEVALRAAFKATQDGKQVAVLVPTTVLAGQHFQTFSPALRGVPADRAAAVAVRVGAKEQEATVEGLAAGTVDIVIGTHRLLSQGRRVPGPRPGRRRRGAAVRRRGQGAPQAAPERRRRAHALARRRSRARSTSRWPGIRDLSVIETPPEDRLPIQTRVAEASAGLVRDAILRELDRGGQVFYVHNRVETIEAQAEQLRRLLPGGADRRRPRADGRGRAREGDAHVRRRRGRRPRVHDDHRVGPRHPERQHDRHRPRRHPRPRPAVPAPGPRRPVVAPRLRLPACTGAASG